MRSSSGIHEATFRVDESSGGVPLDVVPAAKAASVSGDVIDSGCVYTAGGWYYGETNSGFVGGGRVRYRYGLGEPTPPPPPPPTH